MEQEPEGRAVITGTGFHGPDRERIRGLVQSLGSSYSGDLTFGCTTHLVCKELSTAAGGQKFRRAQEWNIPIVSLSWLLDSIRAQRILPVEGYGPGDSTGSGSGVDGGEGNGAAALALADQLRHLAVQERPPPQQQQQQQQPDGDTGPTSMATSPVVAQASLSLGGWQEQQRAPQQGTGEATPQHCGTSSQLTQRGEAAGEQGDFSFGSVCNPRAAASVCGRAAAAPQPASAGAACPTDAASPAAPRGGWFLPSLTAALADASPNGGSIPSVGWREESGGGAAGGVGGSGSTPMATAVDAASLAATAAANGAGGAAATVSVDVEEMNVVGGEGGYEASLAGSDCYVGDGDGADEPMAAIPLPASPLVASPPASQPVATSSRSTASIASHPQQQQQQQQQEEEGRSRSGEFAAAAAAPEPTPVASATATTPAAFNPYLRPGGSDSDSDASDAGLEALRPRALGGQRPDPTPLRSAARPSAGNASGSSGVGVAGGLVGGIGASGRAVLWGDDGSDGVADPMGDECDAVVDSDDDEFTDGSFGRHRQQQQSGQPSARTSTTASSARVVRPLAPKTSALNVADLQAGAALTAGDGSLILKLLARPPRGNTVKARHGLGSVKGCRFAEQVHVASCGVTLSTKEKKRCALLPPDGRSAPAGSSGEQAAVVGEVQAFYQLPSGEWWVEFLRFYPARDLRHLHGQRQDGGSHSSGGDGASGDDGGAGSSGDGSGSGSGSQGAGLNLPLDFDAHYELARGLERMHAPLASVQGDVLVRRSKSGMGALRFRGGAGGVATGADPPFFWRCAYDDAAGRIVTDRPVTDFAQ